jgi:hypothetical protein
VTPLSKRHDLFREAVIDMGDHAAFPSFKLLHGTMFANRLQLLPSCRVDTANMANLVSFPEDHWTVRRRRSQGDVLPTINTDPAACRFSIGNIHRHRETGIPDALARAPEFDRTRGSFPLQHGIQPVLVRGIVDGQRDTFLNPAQQTKRDRVGVTNLMQCPILVVRFQR